VNLTDLDHYIGSDLSVSGTGDLQGATDTIRGQQRILRRLLTNPGEYIFHPEYGAGLPQYVGRTADVPKIRALVRGQIQLEEAVARAPAPEINVAAIPSAAGGGFAITIIYTDAPSGQPVTLSFEVGK
jgi:phage baseplate assembly protein W